MEEVAGDSGAPEQLRSPEVASRGGGIAGNNEPVPDERFTEEAGDDDDQVEDAAEACKSSWRASHFVIWHVDSVYSRLRPESVVLKSCLLTMKRIGAASVAGDWPAPVSVVLCCIRG